MVKKYTHHLFGEINIRRGKFSRNIKLSVHPLRGITISVPWLVSFSRAIDFIKEKEEWIAETIKKQTKKKQEDAIKIGPERPLKLISKEIFFQKPDLLKPLNQLELDVIKVIRKEAKLYLPERVKYLAERTGFKPGKVTVRNNRSNWGSCSKSSNISLNIHLMRLQTELADFVIIHELCHLRHRNHGPQFHSLLDSLCGGKEKELNRLLRKERPQVTFLYEE